MESSNPLQTLVKLVDAEGFANAKVRTLELPLEIIIVISELESQLLFYGSFEPDAEVMFTQANDTYGVTKPQLSVCCNFCRKSKHSVIENNEKPEKENGIPLPVRKRQ